MARAKSESHEFLSQAVRGLPEVTSKRMFGADAFFTRHGMFAFLMDDVIVLKLPEAVRVKMLGSKAARPFLTGEDVPFGRWVELAVGAAGGPEEALRLATIAHQLAQTPDREGPRKRRPRQARRRTAGAKRVPSE